MGCLRNNVQSVSEKAVGNGEAILLGNVPLSACEGQMDFIKRSTGDEIYLGFGRRPTSVGYDAILIDAIPFFNENGLIVGEVYAKGSASTSRISMKISFK